jgi:ferric-dicitrate binding protein FerR (iron transport regulator)
VYIETPAAKMVLHGTDVYLTVDRESGVTVLYVVEGNVKVTGAGRTVRLTSGQWTSVDPGEPPRPAEPFDAVTASLSPAAGGPAFHAAVEDPFFNLRDPRLELPK